MEDYIFKYCTTFSEVKQLVRYCQQTGYCCSDFETNAEAPIEPTSFATILSISFQPGSAWVVPLFHKDSPLKSIAYQVLQYIGIELIENPNVIKIGQNLKFEYKWWLKYGYTMRGVLWDTMLMKYILREERPHDLKSMVSAYIPEFDGYDLKGVPSSKAPREKIIEFWTNVPIDNLSKYGALDADLTHRLFVFFLNRLFETKFIPLVRNLLMMATRVLAEAEVVGMYTDRKYLSELIVKYDQKIKDCEKDLRSLPEIIYYEEKRLYQVKKDLIREIKHELRLLKKNGGTTRQISNKTIKISRLMAGEYTTKKEAELLEPINFGSTKQLADLFFYSEHGFNWDIIHYTVNKKTKKRSNTPSLGEDVLKILKTKHKHPAMDKLMELRSLLKLNSTYIVSMWDKLSSDNKIHGSFLLHGTVTGRLSSRDPNLQNIPRTNTNNDIKPMFICPKLPRPKLMLQLDYSQAELRVLAYLAKEPTMLHWFAIGRDIHTSTCCKSYNVDYDEINAILESEDHPDKKLWGLRRKKAKTTNFGIAYEQGPKKLAEKLTENGVPTTEDEAKEILKEWFKDFPNVKKYIKSQHKLVHKQGYVESLFGRKRRLDDLLYSGNKWKEAEAERVSVNAPIQSSASDFALFSSVLIREAKLKGELPDSLEQFGTVHDSLLYYLYPEDIHTVVPILRKICKNPETLKWFNFEVKGVEMEVDFEIGKDWGSVKKYKPDEDYTKWV